MKFLTPHVPLFQRRWYARNDADHAAYEHNREIHNPSKKLLRAIERGERDTAIFDDLFAQGAILYDRDSYSLDSAMHLAVMAENHVALTWLLEHGLPWWMHDRFDKYAIARAERGSECWKVLMNWMVESGESLDSRSMSRLARILIHTTPFYVDYARFYRPFSPGYDHLQWHRHPLDIIIDNEEYLKKECEYVYREDRGSREAYFIESKTKSAVMADWETPISQSIM